MPGKPEKPPGRNKWSKQHYRPHSNEVSSNKRIRKTTEIGQSESITSDYEFNDDQDWDLY